MSAISLFTNNSSARKLGIAAAIAVLVFGMVMVTGCTSSSFTTTPATAVTTTSPAVVSESKAVTPASVPSGAPAVNMTGAAAEKPAGHDGNITASPGEKGNGGPGGNMSGGNPSGTHPGGTPPSGTPRHNLFITDNTFLFL